MARWRTRSWESIRTEKPLDPAAVRCWDWLTDAEDRIAAAAGRLGGAGAARVQAAYEQVELREAVDGADVVADAIEELRIFTEALGARLIHDDQTGDPTAVVFPHGRVDLPPRDTSP